MSSNSICPWVFIIKPQMYYNMAYCNIYNPVLITMSVSLFFFLGLKCTKTQCDIKMQIFYLFEYQIASWHGLFFCYLYIFKGLFKTAANLWPIGYFQCICGLLQYYHTLFPFSFKKHLPMEVHLTCILQLHMEETTSPKITHFYTFLVW